MVDFAALGPGLLQGPLHGLVAGKHHGTTRAVIESVNGAPALVVRSMVLPRKMGLKGVLASSVRGHSSRLQNHRMILVLVQDDEWRFHAAKFGKRNPEREEVEFPLKLDWLSMNSGLSSIKRILCRQNQP